MTSKVTHDLFERFSFFHPEKPITEALMAFGFECGDGWKDLIWDLCEKIEKELNKDPELKEQFEVVQVKEKFGGLRFYTNTGNDTIYDLISYAEDVSYKTCEICGAPAEIMDDNGWMKTICLDCDTRLCK